jgi:hypothetical protein
VSVEKPCKCTRGDTSKTTAIVALLFVSSLTVAQALPDAPSAVRPAYLGTEVHQTAEFAQNYTPLETESRHPRRLLALAGVVGFAVAADVYDVTETEKGLKAGVAFEGNIWLLPSDKPTAGQLYRRDLLIVGLWASPSVLAWVLRKPEFFFAGLVGPAAIGVKHIGGGNAWKRLLDGQQSNGW